MTVRLNESLGDSILKEIGYCADHKDLIKMCEFINTYEIGLLTEIEELKKQVALCNAEHVWLNF